MTNERGTANKFRLTFGLTAAFMMVVVPLSVEAGVFSSILSAFSSQAASASTATHASLSAVDAELLSALNNPEPFGAHGGAEVYVEDGALVSTGPVSEDEIANSAYRSGEIRIYTVSEGDTLSHIAQMFNVSVNTIKWANEISGSIQPGEELLILPISGIRHTVEKGETLGSIVKSYGGDIDEVIAYNQLASANSISVGDEVVIPGGQIKSAPRSSYAAPSPTKITGSSGGGGGFTHPLPGSIRTQGIHGYNGVDLAAAAGTPIKAAAAGEVIVSKSGGWNGGYGNYIVIRHSNGTQTLYAHNSTNYVGAGAWVSQGQTIATVGSTGRSTGDHLHFEVRGGRNPF